VWFGYFGWLPALIPEAARTFRASDPMVGEVVVDAGGELVQSTPDVEIADADQLVGDGAFAIVRIEPGYEEGGSLLASAARRLRNTAGTRLAARRASGLLKARGYDEAAVVLWDIDQFVHLPGGRSTGRRRLQELLPERALVVGWHGDSPQTVLEAVAEEVGRQVGRTIEYGQPLARQGLVIALADEYVLRIAIGPGRQKIELQEAALQRLAPADPPPVVAQRVPRMFAMGRLGLGDWSAEERLPGSTAPHELAPELLSDCIDFLVALHGVERGEPGAAPLAESAKVLAAACARSEHRDALLELGHTLDAELADLPRGFGHGDFWTRNLLVTGNRLRAVIDWDSSSPGRLPLLDLLHLRLSAHREKTREYLGTALVRHQLPWAEAGGDKVVDEYCRRVGIEVDGKLLKSIVFAYWLDRVAFELGLSPDRAERPVWMRNNVEVVLDSLAEHAPTHPGTRLYT
jgi:aminoglycoside phosphotransferase (APT) family kinase protein